MMPAAICSASACCASAAWRRSGRGAGTARWPASPRPAPTSSPRSSTAGRRRPAKIRQIRLLIGPVTGAPGDGDRALARAIALVLKRPDLIILTGEKGAKPDLVLDAAVTVGRPQAGKEHVGIVWRLARAGGGEIGTVAQQNDVPAGLLDGPWGNIAWSVAVAAQEGIAQLLARADLPG